MIDAKVLLDALPEPLIIADADLRILELNPAAERLLAWKAADLRGFSLSTVLPQREPGRVQAVRQDGSPIDVDLAISTQGQFVVALLRAATEAHQARAERMASIGTLAAGVAHEINNPLVYVVLGLELIEREISKLQSAVSLPTPEDYERIRALSKDALEGAERVRTIVRDLRTFSRHGEERSVPVDVIKTIETSIGHAMGRIQPRARLERDFQPLPVVLGDDARLGQVFLNLLVNAAQAIPAGAPEQNRITVRTRAGAAGQAIVEIEDTGAGMEGWKKERIFEPFWTDKPAGGGIGLGLSIVHGIVTGMGGQVTVQSEPGRGSTFRVVLPARPVEREPETIPARPLESGIVRRPRVLLIDDEPNLGFTLSTGLREHADLVSVRTGNEAVRLLLSDSGFDLILCDLNLPGLDGIDVFEQISRHRPALRDRFVFITGAASTERAREFLDQRPDRRLDKPFRLEQVEELLSRR